MKFGAVMVVLLILLAMPDLCPAGGATSGRKTLDALRELADDGSGRERILDLLREETWSSELLKSFSREETTAEARMVVQSFVPKLQTYLAIQDQGLLVLEATRLTQDIFGSPDFVYNLKLEIIRTVGDRSTAKEQAKLLTLARMLCTKWDAEYSSKRLGMSRKLFFGSLFVGYLLVKFGGSTAITRRMIYVLFFPVIWLRKVTPQSGLAELALVAMIAGDFALCEFVLPQFLAFRLVRRAPAFVLFPDQRSELARQIRARKPITLDGWPERDVEPISVDGEQGPAIGGYGDLIILE